MIHDKAHSCIVGSEFLGIAKDIRIKVKTDERILPEYNEEFFVLKNNCECKIVREVKLSDELYKECMKKIRDKGHNPIGTEGHRLEGSRIYCESRKKPKPLKTTGRQRVVIKGIIAVAHLSKEMSQSSIHTEETRYVSTNDA